MATAFASLGSAVTVLARDGILPAAEPFAGELVTAALRESGVSVQPGAQVDAVHRDDAGAVRITVAGGEPVVADRAHEAAVGHTVAALDQLPGLVLCATGPGLGGVPPRPTCMKAAASSASSGA